MPHSIWIFRLSADRTRVSDTSCICTQHGMLMPAPATLIELLDRLTFVTFYLLLCFLHLLLLSSFEYWCNKWQTLPLIESVITKTTWVTFLWKWVNNIAKFSESSYTLYANITSITLLHMCHTAYRFPDWVQKERVSDTCCSCPQHGMLMPAPATLIELLDRLSVATHLLHTTLFDSSVIFIIKFWVLV